MVSKITPLRIFLVEDNPDIRESLIEHIHELLPAEVIAWSHSERESVDWLREHAREWDVAVVDLFLAQGSGLGVAKSLVHREKRQKVVIFSNYAAPEISRRCLALKVDAVFDKTHGFDDFTVYMLKLAVEITKDDAKGE